MGELKPETFKVMGFLAIGITLIFTGLSGSKAWKQNYEYIFGSYINPSSLVICNLIYIGGLGLGIIGLLCLYHKNKYSILFSLFSSYFFLNLII